MEKPINFSSHAKYQMQLRGATENEVILTIRKGQPRQAKQNRLRRTFEFVFENISWVNQKFYAFKTIDVIFVEEIDKIQVIPVVVYYYNKRR